MCFKKNKNKYKKESKTQVVIIRSVSLRHCWAKGSCWKPMLQPAIIAPSCLKETWPQLQSFPPGRWETDGWWWRCPLVSAFEWPSTPPSVSHNLAEKFQTSYSVEDKYGNVICNFDSEEKKMKHFSVDSEKCQCHILKSVSKKLYLPRIIYVFQALFLKCCSV